MVECSLRMGKAWAQSLAPPKEKKKNTLQPEATGDFQKHKYNIYMCILNI